MGLSRPSSAKRQAASSIPSVPEVQPEVAVDRRLYAGFAVLDAAWRQNPWRGGNAPKRRRCLLEAQIGDRRCGAGAETRQRRCGRRRAEIFVQTLPIEVQAAVTARQQRGNNPLFLAVDSLAAERSDWPVLHDVIPSSGRPRLFGAHANDPMQAISIHGAMSEWDGGMEMASCALTPPGVPASLG